MFSTQSARPGQCVNATWEQVTQNAVMLLILTPITCDPIQPRLEKKVEASSTSVELQNKSSSL